jgi:hypothetical protein
VQTTSRNRRPAPQERKLADLSAQELAELLNLSVGEARHWLTQNDEFPWIHLPVAGVRRLLDSGEFYELCHPFLQYLKVPRDVGCRWRQLRKLLWGQPEFETRYPAAWKALFPEKARKKEVLGLPLPSFGIRVMRQWHGNYVAYAGELKDSSDAFSWTVDFREMGDPPIEQDFRRLNWGYLRGTLLAILTREEFFESVRHLPDRDIAIHEGLFEGLGAPAQSPIRLTDLRLASGLDPGLLKCCLEQPLRLLSRPITREQVIQWKQQVLENPTELAEQGFGDQDTALGGVSFAAAALLLFLDFGMPEMPTASPYRLSEQIESLATVVRKLMDSLDSATKDLEQLLANRGAGKPPRSGSEYYEALHLYRMGQSLEDVAQFLNIEPYSSKTVKGTKSWKKKVKEKLYLGEQIEREQFPRAAEIFAHSDNPHVERKALIAYLEFVRQAHETSWDDLCLYIGGQKIQVNARTQRGFEITRAYIQLGSCLVRGIRSLH